MIKKRKSHSKKRFRIKKKKPLYQKRFFWLFLLGFFLLAGLFYLIVFSSFFRIKEIQISGNQKVAAEEIKILIGEQINKKVFFANSQSIFLFKGKTIENKLLESFIKIDSVNLKRKLPDKLIVEIKERVAMANFCYEYRECFLIDKGGIAFERDGAGIGLLVGISEAISLKEQVISAEELAGVISTKQTLEEKLGLEADGFWLEKKRLDVKVREGWDVYFNLENDVSEQLFNLEMVLKEEISAEMRENLEYIDLRFGSRVYYK